MHKRKFMHGNTWTGLLLLLVGGALLLRQTGYPFPSWLFGWESLLIALGLLVGLRNGFRDFSWLVMILVGAVFLADRIYPDIHLKQFAVPGIIILLGLIFILAPKGKRFCPPRPGRDRMRMPHGHFHYPGEPPASGPAENAFGPSDPSVDTSDSTIDIVSFFSGVKKKVLSKNFKGGEVVCIFGGSEINLANADFVSPIVIEFVQLFGGTKLVVPSNWEIRSEVAAIFGGIDDKRPQAPSVMPEKTVIFKGTVIFGGVEVSSF